MRAIDECLRLNSEIKTLKEQIAEVKAAAMSPKNQIISAPFGVAFTA